MEQLRRHITDPEGVIRRHAPCLLVIFLLTVAVYGRTVSFDFLTNWDDPQYITHNRLVPEFSFSNIVKAFTQTWSGNYAPLQILSYMLDHALWGMNPAGFHLTALLLHGANGILLYTLATRISGRQTAGLIAALIFVSHPVQVESVAWLSQRKTLLSLFFFLIAFLAYLTAQQRNSPSRFYYSLALVAFGASLLSKSTAVVLPLCLAVHDVILAVDRPGKRVWQRLLPFAAAAAAMALLTLYTQQPEAGGGRTPYHGGSPWATFLTMIPVMVRYLSMTVFPHTLSALYIPPIKTVPDTEVVLAALVLAAVFAAGATWYRRSPPLFFWYALFFLPLLPVSQVIPLVTLINDRYLYFPMVGAAGMAGHAALLLYDRLRPGRRWLLCATVACCTTGLSLAAFQRTAVWRDSVTLWSDAAGNHPGSKDIISMRAEAHQNAGQVPEAIRDYRHLFALPGEFSDPRHEQEALRSAALLFMGTGSFADAENLLLRLTGKFPQDPVGFAYLADCYNATGRKDAAETAYRQALGIAPENPHGMIGLASLFLDRNEPDKAAPLLSRAVVVGAEGPDLQVALARLAARSGETGQTLIHLEKAVQYGIANPSRLRLLPEFTPLQGSPRFMGITDGTR